MALVMGLELRSHQNPLPVDMLPDDAPCKIYGAHPKLSPEEGSALADSIEKLLQKFSTEGKISSWGAEVESDGQLLV